MCSHDGVDGVEITKVGQGDVDFYGIVQLTPRRFCDGTEIFEYLCRLCSDIPFDHFHRLGNKRYLSGNPNGISDLDTLRIGTDSLWSGLGGDHGTVGHNVLP